MKQKLFSVALILSFNLSSFGQSSPSTESNESTTNITEYNFETKIPPDPSPVKLGKYSAMKVSNINTFIYDVKIESSQAEINSTENTFLSDFLHFEKRQENPVKSTLESVPSTTPTSDAVTSALSQINTIDSQIISKSNAITSMKDIVTYKSKTDSTKQVQDIANLNNEITELRKQKVALTDALKRAQDDFFVMTSELLNEGKTISDAFDKLEECKEFKNRLIRIAHDPDLTFEKSQDRLGQLLVEFPNCSKPEILVSSFNTTYRSFSTKLKNYLLNPMVISNLKKDDKLNESIKQLSSDVEEIKKKVDGFDYHNLFEEMISMKSALENHNNFNVISEPIKAEKDIIIYKITITPKTGITSNVTLRSNNFPVDVLIKGGIKIDFSTGLFIISDLHDAEYTKTTSPTDDSYSIITKNYDHNKYSASIGALMHVSPRWVSNVCKPAFSVGLGILSTDISSAQIFTGFSGMFGSSEKFIVTAGVVGAKVDYLNNKYSENTPIKTTDIGDDLTEKTTRLGLFFSLTYNITNKKKEN